MLCKLCTDPPSQQRLASQIGTKRHACRWKMHCYRWAANLPRSSINPVSGTSDWEVLPTALAVPTQTANQRNLPSLVSRTTHTARGQSDMDPWWSVTKLSRRRKYRAEPLLGMHCTDLGCWNRLAWTLNAHATCFVGTWATVRCVRRQLTSQIVAGPTFSTTWPPFSAHTTP